MKKHYFLSILLVLLFYTLSAQDKKWSVEASYPISVGDEFDLDGRAILDLGVRYRFLEFGNFELGASLNASMFYSDTQFTAGSFEGELLFDYNQSHIFLQPRIFLEPHIPGLDWLHPSIGLGYTWDFYKFSGISASENSDFSDTEGGLNINLGISYDVYRNWFLQLQYDYIRLEKEFSDDNIGLLKVGAGFRF
jgi:hypothetical protein